MTSLFFTNTLMLAGMAALAIPILIHLLLKRKKKQVPFSTIRFFQLQDEQSSRRRKLRNWLLLALRLLIVTLLVLAFARPYSRQSQASATTRKQHRVIFVLDRSASMLANGTDGQRWSLARQRIQKVLAALEPQDTAALIECTAHASVLSGFAPPAALEQVLHDLPPAYGISSLNEGLQQAVKLFSGNSLDSQSTIYVVTDLQKSSCLSLNTCPIPQDIELNVLPVGDPASPNLAVVRLDSHNDQATAPQAAIASFADDDSQVALGFSLDDRSFASQTLTLKAGTATNLDISLPLLKPGWHDLKAFIKSPDSLELDNTQYACLFVPEPAQVLIVEPKTSARVFEQPTFFVGSALDPSAGSTNLVPGSFSLKQIPPSALSGELSRAHNASHADVVVLPGLKDLPAGTGKTLAAFVQQGGGLILFLDEEISPNRYNSELADLLPARLGTPEQPPDVSPPWRIAFFDTNTVPFAAFRSPNSGDLRIPEFIKRFTLELREGSGRFAFFDDGVPLVVTRAFGNGKVALVNTSADTAWTDWPKHKSFVPFIHGLTAGVAQKTSQTSLYDTNSFVAGEDQDIDMGAQAALAQFKLRKPDGTETQLTSDEKGRLKDPGLFMPGAYSLRDKAGHEVRRLAVNLPIQESNLEALRPADFLQQLVRVQQSPKQTLAAGLFASHNDQRQFWAALLLGALVLLLVEPFVANRTSV